MTPSSPSRPRLVKRARLVAHLVWGLVVALVAVVALAPAPARAHPLAPSLVRLEPEPVPEGDRGDRSAFAVTIRSPRAGSPPVLRSVCTIHASSSALEGEHLVTRERWTCPAEAELRLLAEPGAPAVVVEHLAPDGASTMTVLDASHPSHALDRSRASSFPRWLGLGVEHLLSGLDHVLVVLALIALLGLRRRLVWALTAFTLGHSASLALAATGLVAVPTVVVEVAIAVTLVVLGLELAAPSSRPGLAARYPMAGGLVVGLVHGLGFAGVLADLLGQGTSGLAPALIGFNLGLELGQLALVGAVLALGSGLRVFREARGSSNSFFERTIETGGARLAGWVVGIAGAAWVFDRALP